MTLRGIEEFQAEVMAKFKQIGDRVTRQLNDDARNRANPLLESIFSLLKTELEANCVLRQSIVEQTQSKEKLRNEITKFNSSLSEVCNTPIRSLNAALGVIRSRLSQQKLQIPDEAVFQIAELNARIEHLETELAESKNENTQLTNENSLLNKQNRELKELEESQKTQLTGMKTEINDMSSKLQAIRERFFKLNEEYQSLLYKSKQTSPLRPVVLAIQAIQRLTTQYTLSRSSREEMSLLGQEIHALKADLEAFNVDFGSD